MCDKELLVGYVYDELQPSERNAFESHLVSCGECRDEVEKLQTTRSHLALWAPPEPDLGFQVLRRGTVAARPRFRVSPVWGLAAAAILVLAVASAIANVEVRVGGDGMVIRTGWNRNPAQPAASRPPDVSVEDSRAELQMVSQRLSELEAEIRSRQSNTSGLVAVSTRTTPTAEAEMLRRVRQLLEESEKRQQSMLATRLLQAMRDVEATHRTDLARLQQDITQNQGIRDAEVIRQREMLNQFYRLVGQQR